jgi:hypothetical protein
MRVLLVCGRAPGGEFWLGLALGFDFGFGWAPEVDAISTRPDIHHHRTASRPLCALGLAVGLGACPVPSPCARLRPAASMRHGVPPHVIALSLLAALLLATSYLRSVPPEPLDSVSELDFLAPGDTNALQDQEEAKSESDAYFAASPEPLVEVSAQSAAAAEVKFNPLDKGSVAREIFNAHGKRLIDRDAVGFRAVRENRAAHASRSTTTPPQPRTRPSCRRECTSSPPSSAARTRTAGSPRSSPHWPPISKTPMLRSCTPCGP